MRKQQHKVDERRRRGLMRRSASAALAAFVLATMASAVGPSVAGAQESDDLDTSAIYHYRVNAEDNRVEVSAEVSVTATKPNRSTSRGTTSYYFTGFYLRVPAEAKDLVVAQDGVELDLEVLEEDDWYRDLDIVFRRNIFYRQTATLDVTYWVDGSQLRDDGFVRVNEAFVSFDVWADLGIESSTFYVHVPESFDHDHSRSDFSHLRLGSDEGRSIGEVPEGVRVLKAKFDLEDDDWFWNQLVFTNDDALVRTDVDAGGHSVVIESWPNDTEWATFVSETVEEGLPVLIDLVGVPWPVEGDLTISESNIPYYSGYAGWYSTDDNVIELGDELDGQTLLHEISHAWFNRDLFGERWITEGLAEVYAAEAGRTIGLDDADAPKASLVDSEAKALSLWRNSFSNSAELEQWSYGASWKVTDEIASEVGFDALRSVLIARSEGGLAYLGEGDAEVVDSVDPKGWESYIDLLEEVGQADDLEDLFTDWVAWGPMTDQLQERSETREVYDNFVERSGEWAAPVVVRVAMADWNFEEAEEVMGLASAVLDVRDETAELLGDDGYALPDDVEVAYEAVDADFDAVQVLANDTYDAAAAVLAAADVVYAEPPLFTKIGLIGTDPEIELDAAIGALADGDLELANSESAEAESMVEDAEAIGKKRAAIAGGIAGFVLLLVFVLLWRRRRRAAKTVDDDDVEAVAEGAEVVSVGSDTDALLDVSEPVSDPRDWHEALTPAEALPSNGTDGESNLGTGS